jgi:hypothetical protein
LRLLLQFIFKLLDHPILDSKFLLSRSPNPLQLPLQPLNLVPLLPTHLPNLPIFGLQGIMELPILNLQSLNLSLAELRQPGLLTHQVLPQPCLELHHRHLEPSLIVFQEFVLDVVVLAALADFVGEPLDLQNAVVELFF